MYLANTDVVIDKSFLQGAPKETLQLLFDNHRVLMPFTNFYEFFTTTPDKRVRCFQRIPRGDNPVALVEFVDFIRRWEEENKRPLLDIEHAIRQEQFHFNSELISQTFQFDEDQMKHLADLKVEVSTKSKSIRRARQSCNG